MCGPQVHERVSPDEALQALRTRILQPHALLDKLNVYLYQVRLRFFSISLLLVKRKLNKEMKPTLSLVTCVYED